MNFNQAI